MFENKYLLIIGYINKIFLVFISLGNLAYTTDDFLVSSSVDGISILPILRLLQHSLKK